MAMTPEEKRAKNRERQARFRAAQREKVKPATLPRIGPTGRDDDATTDRLRSKWYSKSIEAATADLLELLTIPPAVENLAFRLMKYARDLDSDAISQRATIDRRYEELVEKLVAACKPRERDELDELRRSFYQGRTSGVDDDPEAPQRRTVNKKS